MRDLHFLLLLVPLGLLALLISSAEVRGSAQQKAKLPRPRQLDAGVSWHRDPKTGELSVAPSAASDNKDGNAGPPAANSIRVTTQLVPVTCSVFAPDGAAITGLTRTDFRIYDEGAEQIISHFRVSTEPASIALVIDASPSVLRDSEAMKQAARALVDGLSAADEVAVVDFSSHTYMQLPFSSDRNLIRSAVARVDVRQLLADTGGSNIYEATYLTTSKIFLGGRVGRKAIVVLTDGQDSGLGLTLDPSSAGPQPGKPGDRLTFEDVVRALEAADIQVFAVSTETRPKIMTPDWLAAHNSATLITRDAREWRIPAYTLYLAELVRRSGGQLYFLRESQSLAEIFRRIAQRIGDEYTLGFDPAAAAASPAHVGWHTLRVEVPGHAGASVIHRAAYYVPTSQ
ncbi:MAG: VWA domain-containing protein [Candidatus Acidiferrales bacterium]